MMKKNKTLTIILIVILSILVIGLTWLMVNLLAGKITVNNFRLFSSTSKELVVDETYNLDFNKIDIYSESGDVYIKESSNNEVKVIVYGEKEKTTVDTINDELIISAKSTFCIGFCFNTNSKIEVYLPESYQNIIKVDSKYGDIELGNIENATLEINEECGDVSVVGANVANINNEYGNIKIGKVNVGNISDSAGNIEIDTIYDAKVENQYGNIEIKNVLNYLDISNDCGDIEIDNLVLNKDSKITDDLGNIEIGNTNEIYIDAETDLGNVDIKNNYPKSKVTLTIKNNCGDIEIEN